MIIMIIFFLATIDNNYKVTIYEKNVKPDKNTVLE